MLNSVCHLKPATVIYYVYLRETHISKIIAVMTSNPKYSHSSFFSKFYEASLQRRGLFCFLVSRLIFSRLPSKDPRRCPTWLTLSCPLPHRYWKIWTDRLSFLKFYVPSSQRQVHFVSITSRLIFLPFSSGDFRIYLTFSTPSCPLPHQWDPLLCKLY